MANNFDKFTERARKVLFLSKEEAERLDHAYVGTEHLLLGLVHEEEGIAARVLVNMGVDLLKVRSAIEFIVGRGESAVIGDIGLTPRAKHAIELSVDEARRLNHSYIGTQHLLLGLLREGEGVAAGILESLGIRPESVRTRVLQVLSEPPIEKGTSKAVVAKAQGDTTQGLEFRLQAAREEGDLARVASIEYMIARTKVRELDARRDWLYDRLLALERRRLEVDIDIREILDELDALKRQRVIAVDQRARAASRKWNERSKETGEENDSEDRR